MSTSDGDAAVPESVQDSLLLCLVVLGTLALCIPGLGFYSDDWDYLATFSLSADQSLPGLFWKAYDPWEWMRPVQILHLALLYSLYGAHPIGYHVTNGAVYLGGILLLQRALLELGLRRVVALTVSVIYATLPHYTADRFWMIASGITLTMPLYFASLLSDLRAVASDGRRFWLWRSLGLLSLLAAALTYELFVPLFFFNLLLSRRKGHEHRRWRAVALGNVLALVVVVIFKVCTTRRFGAAGVGGLDEVVRIGRTLVAVDRSQSDYGLNVLRALWVNFGELGLLLPRTVSRLVAQQPRASAWVVAGLLSLAVFAHLARARETPRESGRLEGARLAWFGFVVFWAGYAIFLTVTDVQITAAGVGNRTALAAALGVALVFAGAVDWISSRLPGRWRRWCYGFLVSAVCGGGIVANDALASFWKSAYRKQQRILAAIREDLPELAPRSVLILDGACPYKGPAPVFEAAWGLSGALRVLYSDPTIDAAVVTPRMRIDDDAVATSLYGFDVRFPYDELLVYDYTRRAHERLRNAGEAREYFGRMNPDLDSDCPASAEGVGVAVF